MMVIHILLSCIDVACELFKCIKEKAEIICGRTLSKAYIGRPANFLDHQVKAIREAAEKAGFHVDKTLPEPIAACLAWYKTAVKGMFPTLKKDTNLLVVEFGEGTLDFSVIRYLGNGRFKVEDNSGLFFDDTDIDNAIMDLVLARLRDEYEVEIDKSNKRMVNKLARLRNICEIAKIEVNNRTKDDNFYEGFLTRNEKLVYEIDVSFLTTETDTMLIPFRDVTDAIMNCMESAVLKPLEYITSKPSQMPGILQHVLLVGKATKLVVFRQLLYKEQFKQRQFEKIDAMNCVSEGAYELACIMNDPNTRMSMSDPIAVSYGLRAGSESS